MTKQFRLTNLDLAKYNVYCDISTKNFLAITKQEAHRINMIISHEQSQGVNKENIDPTAVAEAWLLTPNPATNSYEIMDHAAEHYSIKNLDYHEVMIIPVKQTMSL